MKLTAALAAVAFLVAAPALAQNAKKPSVLDAAKAYTDTKVAAEALAREQADVTERTARTSTDSSLQTQVTALKAKVEGIRTFSVGHSAFVANGSGTHARDELCTWVTSGIYVGVDVPMPAGSTIRSISMTVRDTVADQTAFLVGRVVDSASGYISQGIQVASAGTGRQKLEWAGAYTIEQDEYVSVNMGSTQPGNPGLAVCGVTVTYTEPQ